MSFFGTMRSLGEALGVWDRAAIPAGCVLGKSVYRETKRSAQIANFARRSRPLQPATIRRLREVFPELDLNDVRIRTKCRLPSNRFQQTGSIYAMTFGYTIYWRDELDEDKAEDLVKLIHELTHVEQVRRAGNENAFACEYGKGYVRGGGTLPSHIKRPTQYHRNPLEAEAYTLEATYRDDDGNVLADKLPDGGREPPNRVR